MSNPTAALILSYFARFSSPRCSRQKNSVEPPDAPAAWASRISSQHSSGEIMPGTMGRRRRTAPHPISPVTNRMASSRACGVTTPLSFTLAFAGSSVVMENWKRKLPPAIASDHGLSVISVPLVEKRTGQSSARKKWSSSSPTLNRRSNGSNGSQSPPQWTGVRLRIRFTIIRSVYAHLRVSASSQYRFTRSGSTDRTAFLYFDRFLIPSLDVTPLPAALDPERPTAKNALKQYGQLNAHRLYWSNVSGSPHS